VCRERRLERERRWGLAGLGKPMGKGSRWQSKGRKKVLDSPNPCEGHDFGGYFKKLTRVREDCKMQDPEWGDCSAQVRDGRVCTGWQKQGSGSGGISSLPVHLGGKEKL
jgi:hypothetical protein